MRTKETSIREINHNWYLPPVAPVEMPIGLHHLNTPSCWCDPVVEIDEDGEETVLHRHVTWN
jgi:hypothetical protein